MNNISFKPICELGKVVTGKTPSTEDESNFSTDFPFITPSDIHTFNEKKLCGTERGISLSAAKKMAKNILPADSVCFVCIGSTIGKMCMTTTNSFTNQQINTLIVNKKNNPHYIFYLLRYIKGYFQLLGSGTGSGKGIVNKSTFEKTKIPVVCDIDIQNRIADILSTYDDLIENNNHRIALLEKAAQELYKEWFVRYRFPGHDTAEFENGLPKGWRIQQAQNIFDITIGRTPDRKQFDYFTNNENDALWVSISDMKDNVFITRSSEYLTDEAVNKVNMPMVEADTVLLSFKLSVGRVAITTKLSCTNEAIAHFKTNDKDLLEYTYLYLKLFNYQNLGNTSAIGNAVNSTIIKKMKFVMPDRKLLEEFRNSVKDIFAEIKKLKLSNENLIKQRDLLLPRLMSGNLEV